MSISPPRKELLGLPAGMRARPGDEIKYRAIGARSGRDQMATGPRSKDTRSTLGGALGAYPGHVWGILGAHLAHQLRANRTRSSHEQSTIGARMVHLSEGRLLHTENLRAGSPLSARCSAYAMIRAQRASSVRQARIERVPSVRRS